MELNDICQKIVYKMFMTGDIVECMDKSVDKGCVGHLLTNGMKYIIHHKESLSELGIRDIGGDFIGHFNPCRFRKVD